MIAETAYLQRRLSSAHRDYYEDSAVRKPHPWEKQGADAYQSPEDPTNIFTRLVNLKILPDEEFSQNLLRYEMRLDRQLNRAYRLLRQLQKNPSIDPGQKGTENQGNP